MNTKVIAIAALGTAGLLVSVQVLAHHSFAAEFDADKKLAMTGVVTKVEWTNPHVYFFIEVDADGGKFEEWAFEMGSPNGLMRRGWTRDTLEVGTEVIINGTQARDGSNKGNAQTVTLAENCQRLFAGTSQRDFVEDDSAKSQGCKP
jgi:hypothetical protein